MTDSATAVKILASADITALACTTILGVRYKFTNYAAWSVTVVGPSLVGPWTIYCRPCLSLLDFEGWVGSVAQRSKQSNLFDENFNEHRRSGLR